jgi:hypothetical protein
MTLPTAAVDAPVLASTLNQVYAHINLSAGRFVFTSNGSFVVPPGVHQFRVYMAGRGGQGGNPVVVGDTDNFGGPGGVSPMISAIFTGQAIGATFAIVVGDGTNDGTTKFGTLMQVTAGTAGQDGNPNGSGAMGTPTFPLGQTPVYHSNGLFGAPQAHPVHGGNVFRGFGEGGAGATAGVGAQAGMSGVCVVEW